AAVDLRVAGDCVARILIRDAARAFFIRLRVGRSPPVAYCAVGVELASLVVAPVGQRVADDRRGGAVVHRGVAPGAIERRLQDGGGEVDGVPIRAVVRVHGRR